MIRKKPIIISIANKEVLHILKDPRSLLILFLMPILQLVMFGYALKMEIQTVKIGVIDYSQSALSRQLIESFNGSEFFQLFPFAGEEEQIDVLFKNRAAHAVMIIPIDFTRDMTREALVPVQFLIDAADPNAGTMIRNYINQIIIGFNESGNEVLPIPFEFRGTLLYNPDQKSTYFFVPGIVALLLVMISALLTSITITREKETGTMEQILVSPIRSHEIIIGKVLPYIILAFLIGIVILLIGIFLFEVPFEGSVFLLLILSTLYIITALSLGLMISTIAATQQVAMMLALIATLLPTFLLSGFIFPISSMPEILQYITYLIPAKYYLLIIRGIILKGSTFIQLLMPTLYLGIMSTILLIISIRKFSTNLES
jgi:ABC-2 type transport system permease protein